MDNNKFCLYLWVAFMAWSIFAGSLVAEYYGRRNQMFLDKGYTLTTIAGAPNPVWVKE